MSDTGLQNLNSKYAWRDIAQQDLPKRSAAERAADFLEIYGLYDEATARAQAARCIQCPNPTCVAGCPLCNPIPQWMLLTAEGRFLEAAAVLGSVTNMAELCARVCPSDHLCEQACLLEAISKPVSIQALEQFLVEYAFAHGPADVSTAPPNGRKIAVIGSGPGGLACAEEMAKAGYSVTVFDSSLVPGGLLVNGTPAFRVDKSLVQRRLDMLKKRGVRFEMGIRLGEEPSLSQLRSKFDAVYLGWDARKARPLAIPGAELNGVVQAIPFLLQKNTPVPLDLPPINVHGKSVIVIGGGDTAMDCLRAAIRYGAAEATCVYRRDEADMPCAKRERQNAAEEGARFVFCASPVAVLGGPSGKVAGLRLARTQVTEGVENRRRTFVVRPGTEFDLAADWVISALGFEPLWCPHAGDLEALAANPLGALEVDSQLMTNLPGVFAGGDIVHGPGNILQAVRDARRAALAMDAYLAGSRHS